MTFSMHTLRLALLTLGCCLPLGQSPDAPRIPVLILTGENTTDWRWTSTWMRSVLENSGKFDVEVTLYPDGSLADLRSLDRYQVILIDYVGVRFGEPAESNLLELARQGRGIVAVGGAARAFPDWEEYHALLGCDWDEAGGADPFGPAAIRGKDQHGLTENFGSWTDHQDVLLLGIEPRTETHQVLGVVDRVDPLTGDKSDLPVVLIGQYGEGRTVTSTLGNVSFGDNRTWAAQTDPQYQQFLIRACEWAATGQTTSISRLEPNTLTAADRAEGWQMLFDGEALQGWGEYEGEGLPEERWQVQNGVLVVNPMEGDQVLEAQVFEQFEVELEWKVAESKSEQPAASGGGQANEFGHTDRAGDSLRILRPSGEYNHSRFVATYDGVEQWLNGVKVATYNMTPGEWAYRMTGDRMKSDPELSSKLPLLQVLLKRKGTAVWFRNIKIRRIDAQPAPPVDDGGEQKIALFNGRDLEGWTWVPHVRSNAPSAFETRDGSLINLGLPLGYLRTDATYGDFELDVEWRRDPVTKQGGPGGLMLRIQPEQTEFDNDIFWPQNLDVRIGTNEAGNLIAEREFPMTGDERRFNGLLSRSLRNMENPAGDWNHLVMRLERGSLIVRLNGEVVNSASNVGGVPGSIGLRAEGIEFQFRRIELTPLGD